MAGKKPVLTIYEDDVAKEKVDLKDYNSYESMHELLESKGFVRILTKEEKKEQERLLRKALRKKNQDQYIAERQAARNNMALRTGNVEQRESGQGNVEGEEDTRQENVKEITKMENNHVETKAAESDLINNTVSQLIKYEFQVLAVGAILLGAILISRRKKGKTRSGIGRPRR